MLALAPLVMVAIALESIVGFGATVLVLSLGTWVLPVTALLPAYVPVNMALSASIAWRDWRHVDGALLAQRVLPMAGAGLLVGLSLYRHATRQHDRTEITHQRVTALDTPTRRIREDLLYRFRRLHEAESAAYRLF